MNFTMRLFILCAFVLIFGIGPPNSVAQVRGEGGLSFSVGVPTGEFGDQLESVGFGGHIFGAIGLPGSPLLFGADVGFLIYGRERRNEPFSTTIPDVRVDVVTDNNLVSGHFFVRLQPELEGIRPYADVLIGFKHLFTQTRIQNEGFEDIEIARSTNFNDTALSYGVGGGVQFQVYSGGREKGPSAAYIDLGVKYLIGSRAGYLKEGSIRREDGNVTFDVTNSDTSMLVAQIGVAIRF